MTQKRHTNRTAEVIAIDMTAEHGWYISELIMEITVTGDPRNVIHRNHVLISATSSEEAYSKAVLLGKGGETSYKNPHGEDVRIRFVGIADLDEIDDELEDGAEVLFHYSVDVPKLELESLIPEKGRLRAFAPRTRAVGPDYASAEVVDLVRTTTGIERP
jgi:Domain of unknown function (DUF4288)